MDPLTLRAVLAATGSVDVNGLRIGADNVVDELLLHQYERYGQEADKATRHQQPAHRRVRDTRRTTGRDPI